MPPTADVTVMSEFKVFDSLPPFDAANGRGPFFFSRYGNVRLRDYIIRVKKDF